jgi:3-oxoacyl-[acyl-carrier protein] reductase
VSVALVTGAGSGIGRAAALALGDAGFAIGLIGRSEGRLQETRALAEARGVRAVVAPADVTDEAAVRAAVAAMEAELGVVTALVNNAGSMRAIGPLWSVRPEDWWTDVRSSLGGVYTCSRVVVPGMIAAGEGRIVNVVSYAAVRPAPYETAYAAAKAGVASLTEALAASLEPHGISVFSFAPGFTETEMTRRMIESEEGRRWLPEAGRRAPLDAESSARAIVALLRGDADVLNGRFLHTLDDFETLVARSDEIQRDELYAPRLRRLPGS